MNNFKNHIFRAVIALFVIAQCMVASASTQAAESFIRDVSTKAIRIVESSNSDAAAIKQLEGLFKQTVEITWIAKFVLGRHYKELNSKQLVQFQSAYKDYLLYKYTPKFRNAVGYKFEIKTTKSLGKNYYRVDAKVFDPTKSSPINVEYRVKDMGNGRMLIRDISVENVSLILTHRADFTNFLHDNSFADLMAKLKDKTL